MGLSDVLTVSYDRADNGDAAILMVTRPVAAGVHVIKMLVNEEAIEFYEKLTQWKGKENV